MSAAGKYLRKAEGGYLAWCPGCDEAHFLAVEKPLANGARWSFNGILESPTFSPSLLVRTGAAVDPSVVREVGDPPDVCHSFIHEGQWQFCGDSTHGLSGKTVPMLEFPS